MISGRVPTNDAIRMNDSSRNEAEVPAAAEDAGADHIAIGTPTASPSARATASTCSRVISG